MVNAETCALTTQFAPAERRSAEEIGRQIAEIPAAERLRALIDSVPSIVVVLNAERQILQGNEACEALARELKVEHFAGQRPGEFLACQRAATAPLGCGTTEGCRTCGAVRAILAAAATKRRAAEECRIGTTSGAALDLRVTVSPLAWEGRDYLLAVIDDISAEKRRHVLERIFFHDVLNTAGSINGIAEAIALQPALGYELKDDLRWSAETLVNEIKAQRMLLAAERGELELQPAPVPVKEILQHVRQLYRSAAAKTGREIEIEGGGLEATIETDAIVLQRVMANMVKNALEATRPGQTVQLGADATAERVSLWCHNDDAMPREVALQIFQRSFSTKGRDRGLGTYSMKLLGERVLGGRVSFTSTVERGTRFQIELARGGRDGGASQALR